MEWLNYHHLLHFHTVARERSVRQASKLPRLAQPTLSGQIRTLEESLGDKLLVRQGRSLVLSDAPLGPEVRVNAIAPGFIKTAMTDKLPEDIRNLMLTQIPLERFGLPEDVANVALFLASKYSSYLTGQVIQVDGGMLM